MAGAADSGMRLVLLRGFRRGEICGLADDDVDTDKAAVTVNVALVQVRGKAGMGPAMITRDLYQHVRHQVHVDSAEKVVDLLPGRKGARETGS